MQYPLLQGTNPPVYDITQPAAAGPCRIIFTEKGTYCGLVCRSAVITNGRQGNYLVCA